MSEELQSGTPEAPSAKPRGTRRVRNGEVISKSGDKSIVVRAERRRIHPIYGKVVREFKKIPRARRKERGENRRHRRDRRVPPHEQDEVLAPRRHHDPRSEGMIQELSELVVADNTGAKRAMCFRILGQRKTFAYTGDVIRVAIKEALPTGAVKKGQVCTAVIIRTSHPIRRADGSYIRFDQNACVIVDAKLNPIGSRVFGPVARELRDRNYMKVISLAPEVV